MFFSYYLLYSIVSERVLLRNKKPLGERWRSHAKMDGYRCRFFVRLRVSSISTKPV